MATGQLPVDSSSFDSLEMDTMDSTVDCTSRNRTIVQEELERKLRCRVDRDALVQKNILPAVSTSPIILAQTQQLQRAKTADTLQQKLRDRASRNELYQRNILPDMKLTIHPSLSATQQVLRKKKLADNLNEKLSQRPGVLELVEDKILEPSNPDLVKALESLSTLDARSKTEETKISLTPSPFSLSLSNDGNIFDQNFSDSYSPTQSPGDPNPNAEELPSQKSPSNLFSPPSIPPPPIIFSKQSKSNMPLSNGYSGKAPSPSQARKKQQKPKYRKLRYHEYLPPNKNNGKGGKTTPSKPPKLDTPYALLLQQQQLFLQLQVLQQQYPNGVLVQKLPELMKNMSPSLTEKAQALLKPKTAGMENSNHQITKTHEIPEDIKVHSPLGTGTVTVRLDELKVNNLKAACKEMNVIVSGKKVELIERLLEHNNGVLPATVLADLPKERRQSSFNQSLSFDSQQSTNASPQSPDPDPVFQYPGRNVSSQQMETSNSGISSPSLPQVLPAIEFQQQVDRLCEKKKIDHFSSRGQKMIAPRPDLKQMVAIKLPYSSEGGSETGSQVLQNSRSLPSTPQQLSPVDSTENLIQELMEQSPMQPSSQQPVTSESLMLTSQFGSNPNLGTQYVTPRRSGRASLPNPPPYPGIQSQNFQQVEQITNQYMFQPRSSSMTHRSVSLSGPSSSHLQVNSMLPMTSESTQHISLGVKQTMGPPSEPPPFPTDDGIGFGELVEMETEFGELFKIFENEEQAGLVLPPNHFEHVPQHRDLPQSDSLMFGLPMGGTTQPLKTGSDVCLVPSSGHEMKPSLGTMNYNDMGLINLDTALLGASPNMHSYIPDTHIPHHYDYFQNGLDGNSYKNSSENLNGFANSMEMHSYMDTNHSGLFTNDSSPLLDFNLTS